MKKLGILLIALVTIIMHANAQKPGYEPPKGIPRNIIIIMANGMGMNQIEASVLKNGSVPTFTKFQVTGFSQPWQANGNMPTDSTAAWAIATNKNQAMANKSIKYKNLFDLATAQKMKTAFITTESVTGPTSKIFVLDKPEYKDDEALALDYLKTDLNIIIGGGSKYFDHRSDKRNLFKEFKKEGYIIEYSSRRVGEIMPQKTIALVEKEGLYRASDRKDFLTKAAIGAVRSLTTLDGYLLVVNDTKVDEADKLNNISLLTEEIQDLDKLAETLNAQVGGETLILVIGNYETGGLSIKNGTISKKTWPDVNWQSKRPTATLAPVFATGPGSSQFTGIYSLTDIYTKLEGMLMNTRR